MQTGSASHTTAGTCECPVPPASDVLNFPSWQSFAGCHESLGAFPLRLDFELTVVDDDTSTEDSNAKGIRDVGSWQTKACVKTKLRDHLSHVCQSKKVRQEQSSFWAPGMNVCLEGWSCAGFCCIAQAHTPNRVNSMICQPCNTRNQFGHVINSS